MARKKHLVDVATLAADLDCTVPYIFVLVRQGKIPVYVAGKTLRGARFDRTNVRDVLRRRQWALQTKWYKRLGKGGGLY